MELERWSREIATREQRALVIGKNMPPGGMLALAHARKEYGHATYADQPGMLAYYGRIIERDLRHFDEFLRRVEGAA